ncbi:MAG TPA: hypothetical protein VGI39_17660 [Polyangiaceae bacterium]
MTRIPVHLGLSISLAALALSTPRLASADDAKRACVAASTDGQTLRKDDKLLAARDKLRMCASDPCPTVVKTHCLKWLNEVEGMIPTAVVRATDASGSDVLDAEVTIDGQPSKLGRPETLDPGQHVVLVKRPNGDQKQENFLLVDGDHARVLNVELPAAAASGTAPAAKGAASGAEKEEAPAASHSGGIPAGAWILGGAGVVALATSAIFFAQTSQEFNTLQSTCAPACTDAETSNARTHAVVTDVALGVGLGALGVAVIWAIVGRGSSGPAKTALTLPRLNVRPVTGGGLGSVGISF